MFYPKTPSTPDLLAEWRWLLGGRPRLLGWSSAGDLFFADEAARACRLDAGSAETEIVARSTAEFEALLQDAERADDLLLSAVVEQFEAAHGTLAGGQCLGFTTLPVLGGTYTVENRFAISVIEHAAVTGELHRQIHDLPDGTQVRLKLIR